jgi:hypothetical protein
MVGKALRFYPQSVSWANRSKTEESIEHGSGFEPASSALNGLSAPRLTRADDSATTHRISSEEFEMLGTADGTTACVPGRVWLGGRDSIPFATSRGETR